MIMPPDFIMQEKLLNLKKLIIARKLSIPVWRTRTARYTEPVEYTDYSEWTEMKLGTTWECPYEEARWFEASVTVPEDFAGKHLVLELNLGGEGLVSVNGEALGSLAFYHQINARGNGHALRHRTRIELGERKAGEVLNISIQLNMNYKDHFKAGRFLKYDGTAKTTYVMKQADLCVIDDTAQCFYFDAQNVFDAYNLLSSPADTVIQNTMTKPMANGFEYHLRAMNRDSNLTSRLLAALERATLAIPFFEEPDEMRRHIPQAIEVLKKEMAALPQIDRGYVYLSGIAHLDIVWLWQEKHSVRKVANTALNTLALAQQYPEHVFIFSQPYVLKWLEDFYPDIFKRVQKAVADGNIDPVGNLWVEMDCNLAGGESIVRQLLYGRAFYLEKFGKASDIFLMPDSFGYNAALPQIIKKSGIKYFLSAKLNSNRTYRFPYTLFLWQGLDGTRIPTYLMRNAYNGEVNCDYLDMVYSRQESKHLSDAVCMTYGYGDGGGGPDYVMLENAKRLANMPGIPKAKICKLDAFFEHVTTDTDELPVWNDELYFDRHRGTYTTQAMVKKNNRKAELALRRIEMAASLRKILLGIPYPAAQLEKLWKMILHLQFHDSLPGSSITPVYEDAKKEYDAFWAEYTPLFESILADLTANTAHGEGQNVAWSFLPWDRTEALEDGQVTVPALGWSANKQATAGVTVSASHMENSQLRLELDSKGRITSLIHKATGRELLKAPSNVMQLFEDHAEGRMSAWDTYESYVNSEHNLECDSVTVLESTPAKGVVRLTWHFGKSAITQDLVLYAHSDRVDFLTHVDWHENMHLLKTAFYTNIHSSQATYEVQFGAIQRPTHRNTEYDAIRFEGCGHKWADLSQGDLGLSILNDCKYGYDILGDRMRLTLLRSPIEPDYKADRGEHDFTYSLYPHAGSWENGGTVQAGFQLNEPIHLCSAQSVADKVPESFLRVDHDSLILDTFKEAEDGNGYILRFYESCGKGGTGKITFAKPIQSLSVCDLMEQGNEAAAFAGNSFCFETTPYCIHTFRIAF